MFTVNAPTYASLRAFKPNQVRENFIAARASPSVARRVARSLEALESTDGFA
jgi:hypothetical protein